MASPQFGFIGFGEVAAVFSEAMRERGAEIAAYDIVEDKVLAAGVEFRRLPALLEGASHVLSTVTTQAARQVAEESAPFLRRGQVYVDLNSTSPGVKVEIGRIVGAAPADFVEGAILGAVGAAGASVRILLGGPRGQQAARLLAAFGLNAVFYSLEIGQASMFKMLRSIFSKGLEALILETLIAGRRAGITEDLWKDIVDFMTRNRFDRVAANWVQTHAVASQRRYHEMQQVTETVRELRLDPLVSAATEAFFRRSAALGFREAFPEKPACMEAVVEFVERHLAET